jgi:site-specific recombinase XerD
MGTLRKEGEEMLEEFFVDAQAIGRHRAGVFGPYIDEFVRRLVERGYTKGTVQKHVSAVSRFGRWVSRNGLRVREVSEKTIAEFSGTQRWPSWSQVGGRTALRTLLEQLRALGVAPAPMKPVDSSATTQLVEDFGRYLRDERSLSEQSAVNYCPVARLFLTERFGTHPIELATLCVGDLHAFVSRHLRDYSPKRIQLMLSALRSFLRFLYLRADIPSPLDAHVPTAPAWRQTEPPKWLSGEEIDRVLASCDRDSPAGQRDYAMLLLLARLGLRAGEVVSLELGDIRWETGEITVCGKGPRRKCFPLPEDVGDAIATYLKVARPPCDSRRVFLRVRAPYRGFIGSSSLDCVVRRAIERAGLDPPLKGAHLFRHSLATRMLRHGATLSEIGQILHHASPNTTSIYAKVDITGLRALAQPWPGASL